MSLHADRAAHRSSFTQDQCMGMHADCGHGIIMATGMAQLHMQVMTRPWLVAVAVAVR